MGYVRRIDLLARHHELAACFLYSDTRNEDSTPSDEMHGSKHRDLVLQASKRI